MGSCVSVHKDVESAFKLRLSFKSNKQAVTVNVIPSSPVKDHTPHKSHWSTLPPVSASPDFGSKEESFFDSKPWLDSDCDDDFLSVNGDFTPSRGSTPVHHNFSVGNLLTKGINTPLSEASPTDRKKRLSELFSESGVNEVDVGEQNETGEQKVATETPYVSGANSSVCSSERSTVGGLKSPGQKSLKAAQCCLPALRYNSSFKERKNRASPVASVG